MEGHYEVLDGLFQGIVLSEILAGHLVQTLAYE